MNGKYFLKCDVDGCDHLEFLPEPQSLADMKSEIGRPCPKCGANLLTEQDAELGWQTLENMRAAHAAFAELAVAAGLKLDDLEPKAGGTAVSIRVGMHAGKINIKIDPNHAVD